LNVNPVDQSELLEFVFHTCILLQGVAIDC